jgi:hypothetical protein
MKKLFLFWMAFVLVSWVKLAAATDLIARIHFVGTDKISADTNWLSFTNEFCSAEAQALKTQTLDKLAPAPAVWLRAKIAAGANDGAAQLRPLLDDLLRAEWFLDSHRTAEGTPEFALAIHLDNARAQIWEKHLATVLEAWTKTPVRKIANGWQAALAAKSVRIVRVGNWTVLSCEDATFALGNGVLSKISTTAANNYWLSVDADWPKLVKIFPALNWVDLPEAKFQVIGRSGNLLVNGKIISPQPFAITLDKWMIPTNSIYQPFISFTAARGVAPWLKKQSWAKTFLPAPLPNQFFFWAMDGIPFMTFAAMPVADAHAALTQIHDKLSAPPAVAAQNNLFMPLTMDVTERDITWKGMPFVSPTVQAVHGASGDFLVGGLFPLPPRGKALPPEMFKRLASANLVYYHWELTDLRLKMLLQPAQLAMMMSRHQQLDGEAVATKWLNQIAPTLGDTVTEITQTAPNELTFYRRATGGLTAVELFAFASWLEAKNFPGCDLSVPPPRRKRPPQQTMKLLSVPAAPAPQ